jgi:hypothetical protein
MTFDSAEAQSERRPSANSAPNRRHGTHQKQKDKEKRETKKGKKEKHVLQRLISFAAFSSAKS